MINGHWVRASVRGLSPSSQAGTSVYRFLLPLHWRRRLSTLSHRSHSLTSHHRDKVKDRHRKKCAGPGAGMSYVSTPLTRTRSAHAATQQKPVRRLERNITPAENPSKACVKWRASLSQSKPFYPKKPNLHGCEPHWGPKTRWCPKHLRMHTCVLWQLARLRPSHP